METLRIFISSPADVRPERLVAETVIRRLDQEFAHHFRLEPVLWEREPLLATHHFQDPRNIPKPSGTDIVLVILWSRLGLHLPASDYAGAVSGRTPVTGTEWEFEDALAASKGHGRPDLLVYRKDARVMASLDDDVALEEQRAQRRALEAFTNRWFLDAESKSALAAFHTFADTTGFEEQIALHLRGLLLRRLEATGGDATGPTTIRWHQGSPFRGLESFEPEHAPVFFGRTRARNELRDLLARRSAAGNGFVLVTGNSGSGKSSLVKAGLLPHLSLPGMVERVALCRHAIFRPTDPPVPGQPLAALAAAILRALPELGGLRYTVEHLHGQLLRDPEGVPFVIEQGLDQAGKAAGLTEIARSRLLLVLDQLEELFTDRRIGDDARREFVRVLALLAKAGPVWIVATLRADFYDRMPELPALLSLSRDGIYLLEPPRGAEIAQIITLPAREAGLRFERNDVGIGLDDVIREDAAAEIGNLPLLEYCLDQLWQRRDETGMLRFAAYAEIGGLNGAIARRAEQVVAAAEPAVRAALPGLLRILVTVGQDADSKPAARSLPLAQLAEGDPRRTLADAMLHPSARLLVAAAVENGPPVLRLAHEALLTHWPDAVALVERDRADLSLRARLEQEATLWRSAAPVDRPSLLLRAGKPLTDARDLLARRRADLGPELVEFIEASVTAEQREAEHQRRVRRQQLLWTRAAATILGLLMLAAAGFGWQAWDSGQATRLALARIFVDQAFAQMEKGDYHFAARLGLAARRIAGDGIAEQAGVREVLGALLQIVGESRALVGHEGGVISASFSPDGTRIVTVSGDKTARVWDAASGRGIAILRGHEDLIRSASFSPDGTRIVTVSDDKTARVWDAASGREIAILRGREDAIWSASFSPDGTRIVTASGDQTARVWDAASGREIAILRGHEDLISSASFSPDGTRIVTASGDRTARVWDAASGREIAILRGHEDLISSASFSPDGTRIVTASWDKTARVWDAAGGWEIAILRGHDGWIMSASFGLDGTRIVTASMDKTARVWDAASGREIATLRGHETSMTSASFSPDGTRIVTASRDKTARVWDAASGRAIAILRGHKAGIESASFSPDGTRIVTASEDKTARVWDASGREITILRGHKAGIESASFSPDGTRIVTASRDETARVWEVASGREITILRGHDEASFSPDGTRIVTASGDKTARVWDAASGREITILRGHEDFIRSASFSPDGTRIVTASRDETARVWEVASGREITILRGHENVISSASFSPDGTRIVTASDDKTARVWDAASGREIAILRDHDGWIMSASFSPDGTRIVTASDDKTARVWDAASGREIAILRGHEDRIRSASFSPDGTRIVTASDDKTARGWDAASGRVIAILRGHDSWIRSASFSPDSTRIVTASTDKTARVWDAVSGREIAILRGHEREVWSASFSPDGTRIVTASWDQTAGIWDVTRLTQALNRLVRDTCTRFLLPRPGSRSLGLAELNAFPALREALEQQGLINSDLCADVPGVPPLVPQPR
ncbi:AAA family ATPase [Niveispirillum sp. SYP-B3756]|uniref:nSTAND1 domain-containing NTPase n=1 Tax=Niveispirillum sp. SYP-B3756 TaxID=2662178 RepID=UPI001567A251|nr:AAA family ATPase [Niveispirillum sp. SYP-B3756]